jgi:putative transposase
MRTAYKVRAYPDPEQSVMLSRTSYGRTLVVVDRFYPSSKMCSACGHLPPSLSLGTRQWTCPGCGARHDRDITARKNILAAGRGVARTGDACEGVVRRHGATRPQTPAKQEPSGVSPRIPVLQGGE